MTGGTGLIGSWLLECMQRANRLLGAGIAVTIPSRDPAKARTLDVFDVNVLGTRRLLDLASKAGASRFLLLSSGAVYGSQPLDLLHVPENHLQAPDTLQLASAYGEGKRAAEWLASAYGRSSTMVSSVARIFALLGPGTPLDGPFAAGNFIRDALAGQALRMSGDGSPLRSFLYMADACIWLLHVLGRGGNAEAYNVGSERALSIAELANLVRVTAEAGKPGTMPAEVTASAAPRYVPNTTKARRELQLQEWTPLNVALDKTMTWLRATPCK